MNGDVPGGDARQFVLGIVKEQIAETAASIQNANPLYAGIIPKIPVINSICFNGTERLGITLTDNSGGTDQAPAQPTAADNQQIIELQGLKLPPGITFSVQITPQGLSRVMNEVWAKLTSMNKRVDGDGQPDPKGQVQLNSFTLGMAGTILLIVNGIFHTDTKTAPDVPFNVISIDNYVIQQISDGTSIRGVVTDMPLVNVNPNFSALKAWERGIEASIGIILGLFGIAPIEVVQGMIDSQISTSLSGVSLGPSIGSLFQPVFISQVLIPGGDTKLTLSYTSVVTNPLSGILASSTLLPKVSRRNPSIEILGPGLVTQIGSAQRPSAEFSVGLTDIDNPTSVKWSGSATFAPIPGQGVPLTVVATFPYASVKPVFRTISVEVTDDSGLGPFKASLTVMVMIAPVSKPVRPVIIQPKRPFPFQQ